MEHDLILARYGEIGLKSRSVRARFESQLRSNLEYAFEKEALDVVVTRTPGRFLLHTSDIPRGLEILPRIFGLTSASPCRRAPSELAILREAAVDYARVWRKEHPEATTFAIRARRAGSHPYTSNDLAVDLGAAVGSDVVEGRKLKVHLDEPDLALHVEVRDDKAYLFADVVDGPGGLPLGTAGRVAALLKDRNSVVAAWLMMKRGATVLPIHFEGPTGRPESAARFEAALKRWYFRGHLHAVPLPETSRLPSEAVCALCMRLMYRKAEDFARGRRVKAIVTGEVLSSTTAPIMGITAGATSLNVLRPLMGLLPSVIQEMADRIGLEAEAARAEREPCPLRRAGRPSAEAVAAHEADLGLAVAGPAAPGGVA